MQKLTIRPFTPEDIPQIVDLQQAYQQAYPHATIVPGEVYLSPGFEGGRNIFCALDDEGMLLGYAPLFPVLNESADLPNTVWAEVKARAAQPKAMDMKQALFEAAVGRAKEIKAAHPGQAIHLTFQYHPSETASIDFVCGHGGEYTESVYRLARDLSAELPDVPAPTGLDIRRWHVDTEAELRAYVDARNEVFPETPVALADWQAFQASPAWKDGTQLAAFDEDEVVGCVATYWDDTLQQATGCEAGYTEYVFVREKWRGRGVAAHLIAQAMAYLKEHGREMALLEVKASNESALGLYLRLGYQKVDETRFYVIQV